ncbi:MAG: GNAT family N-acetyltransferase [Candidatus Hodarchaeales archaeon]|jgi:ribosomal protein S18 acetylase RimI-like enzyme
MIVIRKKKESDFITAVNFITQLQSIKEHFIGYFGESCDEISLYIKELEPDWRITSLLAYDEEKLIGIIMAEYDRELKRAWIHGPMVVYHNWHFVADKLFDELMNQVIPSYISDFELYGERANTNLKTFSERHGYLLTDPSFVLSLPREEDVSPAKITGKEITKEYYEAFQLLHAKIFPRTYYSGKQIIDMLDGKNKLFIEIKNRELLGFIHAKLEESNQEGYIEFVGVKESSRQKGVGTKLVITALYWLFSSFPQIKNVSLTVSEKNTPAVQLYTNVGFKTVKSLQGYRKIIHSIK